MLYMSNDYDTQFIKIKQILSDKRIVSIWHLSICNIIYSGSRSDRVSKISFLLSALQN